MSTYHGVWPGASVRRRGHQAHSIRRRVRHQRRACCESKRRKHFQVEANYLKGIVNIVFKINHHRRALTKI